MVLSAIASGWNGIVRKQTLMDNNFDLKRVKGYPTTGPFKFIEYSDNESFEVERNDDYWNGELPYLDGLKFLHAARMNPRRPRYYFLAAWTLVLPWSLGAGRRQQTQLE